MDLIPILIVQQVKPKQNLMRIRSVISSNVYFIAFLRAHLYDVQINAISNMF